MRIQEIDGETMARIITRCEREITEMKTAQCVGADGVQVFRVKLEAAIDKRDATFLRRFKIVFTPKASTYQSGMVFKLMIGRRNSHGSGLEDVTRYFQRRRSNSGVQTWLNVSDFLVDLGSNTFKIYAFATSDGELRVEYV
jgi:hypothetical protein|nr:MAG TPA: hypothetical protein [Caudoviricetes sp.]